MLYNRNNVFSKHAESLIRIMKNNLLVLGKQRAKTSAPEDEEQLEIYEQ